MSMPAQSSAVDEGVKLSQEELYDTLTKQYPFLNEPIPPVKGYGDEKIHSNYRMDPSYVLTNQELFSPSEIKLAESGVNVYGRYLNEDAINHSLDASDAPDYDKTRTYLTVLDSLLNLGPHGTYIDMMDSETIHDIPIQMPNFLGETDDHADAMIKWGWDPETSNYNLDVPDTLVAPNFDLVLQEVMHLIQRYGKQSRGGAAPFPANKEQYGTYDDYISNSNYNRSYIEEVLGGNVYQMHPWEAQEYEAHVDLYRNIAQDLFGIPTKPFSILKDDYKNLAIADRLGIESDISKGWRGFGMVPGFKTGQGIGYPSDLNFGNSIPNDVVRSKFYPTEYFSKSWDDTTSAPTVLLESILENQFPSPIQLSGLEHYTKHKDRDGTEGYK